MSNGIAKIEDSFNDIWEKGHVDEKWTIIIETQLSLFYDSIFYGNINDLITIYNGIRNMLFVLRTQNK